MFLISDAHAQAAGDPVGGLMSFLPLLLIFGVFYFMIMRPQLKRQKEQRALIAALKKGDEVVTAGGVVGKVVALDDAFVTLAISALGGQTVELVVQRVAVSQILPTGTLKL